MSQSGQSGKSSPPGDDDRTLISSAPAMPASGTESPRTAASPAVDVGEPDLGTLRVLLGQPPGERLVPQRRLGVGGMGRVDLVIDPTLRRRLAAKIMAPDLLDQPRAVSLFIREARITAQLDHPAIVPVHELWMNHDGALCFSMKVVEGETLERFVEQLRGQAGLAWLDDILEILLKICDALAFAHSRGVVHCDLKPQNVMIGSFGEVYLMDWGISRAPSRLEQGERGGAVAGTPAFMAPEQAGSGRVDERTDVFGVGALLYYALSGRGLYQGETVAEKIELARQGAIVAPELAGDGAEIPSALYRIMMRALSRDPSDRHQTMVELRDELRAFMRGGGAFERRLVPAGEHILREGEDGTEVYYLERGKAEAYRIDAGRRVVLGEMTAGEVFGEMAILTSSLRTASVVAVEDCVLVVVTPEALEREMSGMTPWMAALTRTLARRFRERESARL